MVQLTGTTNSVAAISRLVHELQRWRGMPVLLLSSKGAEMREELADQRKRTDEQRRMLS